MERRDDLLAAQRFPAKIFLHELLARGSDRLVKHVPAGLDSFLVPRGDCDFFPRAVLSEAHRLHLDEVKQSHNLVPFHNGNDDGAHGLPEHFVHLSEYPLESRLGIVAFIDEKRTRHFGFAHHIPRKLRADLDARLSVHDDQRAARDAKRLHGLADKVQISRGVDDVDFCSLICDRRNRRGKRKASFHFLRIIIADRISVGRFAEPVRCLCQIEHGLGKRGLAARAVAEQANIPDIS